MEEKAEVTGCVQNMKLLQLPYERLSIASLLNRVEADMIMRAHSYQASSYGACNVRQVQLVCLSQAASNDDHFKAT